MLRKYKSWRSSHAGRDQNSNALILGMSANATMEEQDEGFALGLHMFATKPVRPEYLGMLLEARRSSVEVVEVMDTFLRLRSSRECHSHNQRSGLSQSIRIVECSCAHAW